MAQKLYIAFSIAGSNCFITAAKEVSVLRTGKDDTIIVDNLTFTRGVSRRADFKPEDGIKLLHNRLMTKTHKPVRAAPMVMKFFNELESLGWIVDRKNFVKKHWAKKKK